MLRRSPRLEGVPAGLLLGHAFLMAIAGASTSSYPRPTGPTQEKTVLGGARDDGTCCLGLASCGGNTAENTGGWGHVPRDLRFRDPLASERDSSTTKITPRPYALDVSGGYTYMMPYYGDYIYQAQGYLAHGPLPAISRIMVNSPYYGIHARKSTGLFRRAAATVHDSVVPWKDRQQQVATRRRLWWTMQHDTPEGRHEGARRIQLRRSESSNSSNSSNASVPTAAPTAAPTPLPTGAGSRRLLTNAPTVAPTAPTAAPTIAPTSPTAAPTAAPTTAPTSPTAAPTAAPTTAPTSPTAAPTAAPTVAPTTPTAAPTTAPTLAPAGSTVAPTLAPAPIPQSVLATPLPPWNEEAPPSYLPVANMFVMPRNGNRVSTHNGYHLPICARDTVAPPTRIPPVVEPPPPPPYPPPLQPAMTCWDGTICRGRLESQEYQCCSAPVKALNTEDNTFTCSQIFVCDKKRTCTGKRACFQAFESQWDKNNNGMELAYIYSFIVVMMMFLCLFCLYCFCDRCVFNRRAYAAARERKKYLKALPQLSSMEGQ